MLKKVSFIFLFIYLFTITPIWSETIYLRGDKVINGQIIKSNGDLISVKTYDNSTKTINKNDISKIFFNKITKKNNSPNVVKKKIDSSAEKIIKEFNSLPKFPEAGAIYLLDSKIARLNKDGSSVTTLHYIIKILKDRCKGYAFNSYSYDKQREGVEIIMGRTIKKDGSVINLNLNNVTDKEEFQGDRFYSRYKSKAFTLPNVVVGDIIEFKVNLITYKPLFKGYFTPSYYFTNSEPTIHTYFKVIIPADRELNYKYRNNDGYDLKVKIGKTKNGEKYYLWQRDNVPALVEESKRPPYNEIVSNVACSMFKNWDPIFDWNGNILKKNVESTSDKINELAEKLTKNCKTEDEKMEKIYYWMQRNIRYISIKGDVVAGLAGHPAQETFEKKYGDCVDKAVLMSAMLNHLGIDAAPLGTMTNRGGDWITDIPAYYVNHSFVYIKRKDGREMFLDPTTQDYRYPFFRSDDYDVKTMIATKRIFRTTNLPLIYSSIYDKKIKVNEDKSLEITNKLKFSGSLEASYRGYLKHLKPKERQDALTKFLNSVYPGTEILKPFELGDINDLSKQFFINQYYKIKDYATKASDLLIFRLPISEKNYPEIALEKRKYPLEYHTLAAYRGKIDVNIPKNYKVEFLPEPLKINSPYFKYSGKYEKKDGGFKFTEDYQRLKHKIPVKEYDAYKNDVKKLINFSKLKVILKRK